VDNSPVCLDANLVVRLVVDDPLGERITSLLRSWVSDARPILAPTLLYFEVSNALHRYRRHGLLTSAAAEEALAAALALPIRLHAEPRLHRQALQMAERFNLAAAYDSHYLALAEILGAQFWTADSKLVRALGSAPDWIHLLE